MKSKTLALVLLGFVSLVSFSAAQTATPNAPAKKAPIDASAAIPKNDKAFHEKHASFLARAQQGPVGLLFLGDSITEGWKKAPAIWEKYYGPYQPANFGIGGDATHHVIWRIENGELDNIKPKAVVFMLGTNNTGIHTAAQIAAADKKIISMIRQKLPETKVLVLAIFPRGPRKNRDGSIDDGVKKMEIIAAVNQELAKLHDGKHVFFLDINAKFLGADGKIPDSIMPDQLHPNVAGYQIWADAMQPTLAKLLQ